MANDVVTPERMREIDRRCIEELGMPGCVLMNTAGHAVFAEVTRGPVGIVCGKGNNGGDGFVVARLALLAGYEPRVLVLASPDAIRGDARLYLDVYRKLGGPIAFEQDPAAVQHAMAQFADCAVMVDAILGTGATGAVREPARTAIAAWPPVLTVAVDVPSGLNAATGEPGPVCIRAGVTVTLAFNKTGFLTPAAKPFLGRLVVADIGIPSICADDQAWETLKQEWAGS